MTSPPNTTTEGASLHEGKPICPGQLTAPTDRKVRRRCGHPHPLDLNAGVCGVHEAEGCLPSAEPRPL